LNVNSNTFVVNKDTKLAIVAVPLQRMGEDAIQAASGTGGFGNKQTSMALDNQKVVYKDIFQHNMNVSV